MVDTMLGRCLAKTLLLFGIFVVLPVWKGKEFLQRLRDLIAEFSTVKWSWAEILDVAIALLIVVIFAGVVSGIFILAWRFTGFANYREEVDAIKVRLDRMERESSKGRARRHRRNRRQAASPS